MNDKRNGMVMAAFAADSLALGVHWIYDPGMIASVFGRGGSLLAPGPQSYHPSRSRGDFTHYGDQMLVLLESVAETGGFGISDFESRWRRLFDGYGGYIDGATRATLANYGAGKPSGGAGSRSDDLAGAARIAPIVCRYRDDPETLAESAKAQTRMTHADPATVEFAEFFALVAQAVLSGAAPTEAMISVAESRFDVSPISAWLQKGRAVKGRDSVSVIGDFGRSCHTGEMFPGVVHLITTYENDLREGIVQSILAAGDNAARGTLVGMVLGAHMGMKHLPRSWVDGLNAREMIEALLEKIP